MERLTINEQTLEDLYSGCKETTSEIFAEFINKYPEFRKGVGELYDAKDWAGLKKLLHSYAPSFLYIGLPEVTDQVKDLEKTCMQEPVIVSAIENKYNNLLGLIDQSYALASAYRKNNLTTAA